MLELRLMRAGLLKKVFESIKDLLTDANFDYSTTGFSLQVVDSMSLVGLMALLLHGFEQYCCDRNISKGMNLLADIANTLSCAFDDDIVAIKADDGSGTLTLLFEKPYTIGDTGIEHLGIPEAEYQAIVRMPASEFARICKDLSTIGDTVIISVTKERVHFSTKGDTGIAHISCRKSTPLVKEEEAISIEMELPISLTFASRYLIAFTKATPLAGLVTISMSYDMPVVIECKMETIGYIRFYLAPKLEEVDGPVENVPKVDTKSELDVKSVEVIEIEEGSELKVEWKRRRCI